jgi:hypothetical protein
LGAEGCYLSYFPAPASTLHTPIGTCQVRDYSNSVAQALLESGRKKFTFFTFFVKNNIENNGDVIVSLKTDSATLRAGSLTTPLN